MFDSLTKIFEGKNIHWKITLGNQLKNVKIHNYETIPSYFTRVSQNKEKLVAVEEEVEIAEVVIATLNDLRGSWESIHMRNVCQKEVITFSRLWEEEEARLIIREEKMGATKDLALTIQRRSLKRRGI